MPSGAGIQVLHGCRPARVVEMVGLKFPGNERKPFGGLRLLNSIGLGGTLVRTGLSGKGGKERVRDDGPSHSWAPLRPGRTHGGYNGEGTKGERQKLVR